jgi:hypothetical protein
MNSDTPYLLINKIDINKININTNYDFYRIYYKYNNSICFNKIIFELNNYTVKINANAVKLYSKHFGNLNLLDTFFTANRFNSIFHTDKNNNKYILLSNNIYTKNINNYTTVYIYVKYVKKYNNIPIIHLLYGK